MGVDCQIKLPDNVSIRYVSKVLGVLAGCPPKKSEEGFVDVHDARPSRLLFDGIEGCANIVAENISGDALKTRGGESTLIVLYHFEPTGGGRLLMPRSTAFWIAIGKGLVDFFGGRLVYADCDGTVFYDVKQKSDDENHPEDDDAFWNLQERVFNLKPLTMKDFIDADKHAAYKLNGSR